MAFLDRFRLTKSVADRKSGDTPVQPNSINRTGTKRPIVTYENAIAADAAMMHPLVFFCLHKIASSLMACHWYAEIDESVPVNDRAGERQIKEMNKLLSNPNINFDAAQLRYWMALNYACFGRVPMKIGVSSDGTPNGIYPLSVRWTTIETDTRGLVVRYNYGPAGQEAKFPPRDKASPLESYAYEIFTPNIEGGLDARNNTTALRSIGLPSQVMRLLLQRAIDSAEGHPNMKYVISTEKTLTDKQQESLIEFIEDSKAGANESGNILFMYNATIKIDVLDNDLSDIHSKLPSDDMARIILRNFGIPVALAGLGAADGAKYANNYDGSRMAFWEDTMVPNYTTPIAAGMTRALCPPGMVIKFDIDSVPGIAAARATRMKDLATVTFITDDEKRELAGYPPLTAVQKAELLAARTPVAKPGTPATTTGDNT